MKICVIVKRFHSTAIFGGAERSALRLASALAAAGSEVDAIGARLSRSWPRRERIEGPLWSLRVSRLPHPRIRFIGTLVFNLGLLARLAGGACRWDAAYVTFASFEMMTAALARSLGGPPVICKIACGGEPGEIAQARRRFYYPLFRRMLRRVDMFIALSDAIAAELVSEGIAPDRIERAPNGIDVERFRPPDSIARHAARAAIGAGYSTIVLLFVGRLAPQKGLDILLDSLALLRDDSLVLLAAGAGNDRERLEEKARSLGLGGVVRFLGARDDVADLCRAADIFVLPSRDEGLPNALLEGMAAGLPAIASRVGAAADVIEDGVSGLLVPRGDAGALATAIRRLADDAALRERMGREAASRIRGGWTIDHAARRLVEVAERLRRSRVLFLINSYPPRVGGAERLVESLTAELAKARSRSIVVTRRERGSPLVERLPAATIFRIPVAGGAVGRSLLYRAAASALLAALRRSYEVIHAHSLDAPADVAAAVGHSLGKRVFITIHNTGKVNSLLARRGGRARFERMLGGCDSFITINSDMTSELEAAGCPRARIALIPNGVDTERFTIAPDEEKRRGTLAMGLMDRTVFVFVGNLHAQKGLDVLLEAWRMLESRMPPNRALLLVIGDGVLLGEMRALAERLGIGDSVRFLGKRSDVRNYLRFADVFVQPSRWEGLSIALLEALACGLAVVATPVGGAREIIRDGANGLLTPVDDAAALASRLESLLDNPELRRSLSRAARRTAVERYSLARCAAAHRALFSGGRISGETDESQRDQAGDAAPLQRDEPAPGAEARELSRTLS